MTGVLVQLGHPRKHGARCMMHIFCSLLEMSEAWRICKKKKNIRPTLIVVGNLTLVVHA